MLLLFLVYIYSIISPNPILIIKAPTLLRHLDTGSGSRDESSKAEEI